MEFSNESVEISKLFKDVMGLLRHHMSKVFETAEFTSPQGMVMGILSKYGKMKVSELSGKLALSNSTVSGILDRLEKQNMIERERSKEDKRVVFISTTTKFDKVHQDFHKKAEKNIEDILNRGTPEDIQKIIDGMNTLKKLLKE